MNLLVKSAIAASLVLAFSASAEAQVCRESNGPAVGKANLTCDMRYRDQLVTCSKLHPTSTTEVVGTRDACPKKPMPMLDTPKKSYITDYSPYLWQFPRDPENPSAPYSGRYSLGTPGDASRTFQLFGDAAPNAKRMAPCTTQIKLPAGDPTTHEDWAKYIRLQADNCANQYLLRSAIYPFQKGTELTPALNSVQPGGTKILDGTDPTRPGLPITLTSDCQPLKLFQDTTNEYSASEYIEAAWIKLLKDPEYRKATTAVKNVPCLGTGLSDKGLPCDHEPHLPAGISLINPQEPPSPFPEVTLAQISTVPYEDINDPTHPYSPRWDFLLNDRDYANMSLSSIASFSATAVAVQQGLKTYMTEAKNNVYCAGVRESKESDAKKKSDDEVKVDVLSFRKGKESTAGAAAIAAIALSKAKLNILQAAAAMSVLNSIDDKQFEGSLTKRTLYNTVCYAHEDKYEKEHKPAAPLTAPESALFPSPLFTPAFGTGTGEFLPKVMLTTYCWHLTGTYVYLLNLPWPLPPIPIPLPYAEGKDCWKCFGLSGQVDDESKHPPCTTNYLGKDLKMVSGTRPGALNSMRRNAICGTKFDKICRDLRKPFTPLNKLKMRYHNPDDEDDKDGDNIVLKDEPLEGMTFKEYFGNHMPYPRVWDLGQSLQRSPTSDKNNQPPTDVTGQYTAIVGVGREAAAKVASDAVPEDAAGKKPADNFTDQRCKTMGWGGVSVGGVPVPTTFGGLTIFTPDPVTSWTEMKLYETRAMRMGLICLPRYEKLFKSGSAENMMLMVAGGEFPNLVIQKCKRVAPGRSDDCETMTYEEWDKAGKPDSDANFMYMIQTNPDAIPLVWRGYMAAKDTKSKFPNFGDTPAGGSFATGLDKAITGDIVMMPNGPGDNILKPGLAKLAYVIETNLKKDNPKCETEKNCFIRVLEPDDGKWPDICGTTDTWGQMKTRYYFKPGHLPVDAVAEYDHIKSTGSCEETKISHCEQKGWSSLKLYHPYSDVREPCKVNPDAPYCAEEKK